MSLLVKALSEYFLRVGGSQTPSIEAARAFQDGRLTELNQEPTNEILLAEVNFLYGAAYRHIHRTGEAIVHFTAAHEGYLLFEHPDNVRAAALCAWAAAESYLTEENFAKAKTWYWKALETYTRLDGLGAESTRACLEDFQDKAANTLLSSILSSHLRGIKRLSDMVANKG